MKLTEKEIKKLERLSKISKEKELAILDEIDKVDEKIDSSVAILDNKVEDTIKLVQEVKKMEGPQGPRGPQGESIKGDKGEKGDKGDTTIVEKVIEKIEVIKEQPIVTEVTKETTVENPVSAQEVRDKLETLKDDERLDVSAIKGIDKREGALTDSIVSRAFGIVDQRTSFLINKVSDLKTQLDNNIASDIAGSISANQIAYGTAANTIGGSNEMTFDGTTLTANSFKLRDIPFVNPSTLDSFFIGINAGAGATPDFSIFLGSSSGANATNASESVFIGDLAGDGATDSEWATFVGSIAGQDATTAQYSTFIGSFAGTRATNATLSTFVGSAAGTDSPNASYSVFLGYGAGSGSSNAANSLFLGVDAGSGDTVNNTLGGTSIAIGWNAGTGGYSNSISIGRGVINSATQQFNIGNVLYGTGIYNSNTRSSAPVAGGKIGIGTNAPSEELHVVGDTLVSGTVITNDIAPTSGNLNLTAPAGASIIYNIASDGSEGTLEFGGNTMTWNPNAVTYLESESIYYSSSGQLGIGTFSPSEKLHVIGNGIISGSLTLGTALSATNGGTGQSTVTTGDLLYSSASNVWSKLAGVATGNALISGGVATAPSWGKIGLTTHISGTLAVGNGGTGATTFTNNRLLTGNGTSAIVDEANLTFDGNRLTVLGSANQLRTGYDASNYLDINTSSAGLTIINAVGTGAALRLYQGGSGYLHFYQAPSTDGRNVFIGGDSGNFTMAFGSASTDASRNLGIGVLTLNQLTTGSGNTAIGSEALRYLTTGTGNVGLGSAALGGGSATNHINNMAIGASTLSSLSSQSIGQVAVGTRALRALSTGSANTAIGYYSGDAMTTGSQNVFLGFGTSQTGNPTGEVSIGYQAHSNAGGTGGTYIGWNTGQKVTTGDNNVMIGYGSGYTGGTLTGVANNTFLGTQTGASIISSQSGNTFLGYRAGYRETGSNTLIIDNQDRGSEALGRSGALLYGTFNSTAANQVLTTSGNFGVGTGTTVSAKTHIISTTEQLRIGYDTSNYYSTTVSSAGAVTLDAVGASSSFIFSDPVTINGALTLSAQNIVTDTTTGMKIGTGTTQKIGFFNATPIVQQTTTSQTPSTFVANTSGIVDDTATWDGYTIGDIVKILRTFGLIA